MDPQSILTERKGRKNAPASPLDDVQSFRGRRFFSALIALFLCLVLLTAHAQPALPLDDDGFLSPDYGPDEYIEISPEEGRWVYLSRELNITVTRFTQENPKLVWFESEIRLRGDTRMQSYLTPGKTPGKRLVSPIKLARDNSLVLAISDDFYSLRQRDNRKPGIIIRNGMVLHERTHKSDQPSFPNLETIARFSDGSLKTFSSNAHTAEEYLAMGVTDVYAFGPILVSGGQPGPHMQDENYYRSREPRCALGMIAPNHYIVLTVKGRSDDSYGAHLTWLGRRMMELGAVEALNLDGGGSVALVFMGEIINRPKNSKGLRSVGSIIGFGSSSSLAEEQEKK